jgi:predicted HNH restriction endonuclease
LAKANTVEKAQAVLDRYLPQHNRRFSKPAQAMSAWTKASSQQIDQALCFKEKRTVANDNTVTFDGVIFQIPKKSPHRSYAHKRIDVHVLLDGAVEFFYQQEKIAAFDSKKTHAFGLYRTQKKREGFRYGPISIQSTEYQQLSP